MTKLLTNLVAGAIKSLLYFFIITFFLALVYSGYQSLSNVDSWSEIIELLIKVPQQLPGLNNPFYNL